MGSNRVSPSLSAGELLSESGLRGTLSRRTLLMHAMRLGVAVPVAGGLLAACNGDVDDEPADEPADDPVDAPDDDAPDDDVDVDDDVDDDVDEPTDDRYGGTLNVAIVRDPTTLDPHISDGATSWIMQNNVYDRLVDYDEEGVLTPSLAESWEISDDAVYTFELRSNVVFHHGGAMTADDVVFSFDRILDETTNASLASQMAAMVSYEAVDDHTVEVTLEEPNASFLTILAFWAAAIISREYTEANDPDYATTMNGTGPFKQEDFEAEVRYLFLKHDEYWKEGLPYLDAIDMRPIRDEGARVAAFRAGDVDYSHYIPWHVLDSIDENPDQEGFVVYFLFNLIQLNPNSPIVDDPLVRRALGYVIDRDAVNDLAFGGLGRIITGGLIPPESEFFNEDLDGTYAYDPDRARELLAEAGYDDPSEISLNVRSSNLTMILDTAEVVVSQLRDFGFDVELEPSDSPTHIERRQTGDYQLLVDGLGLDWEDPDFYSIRFATGAPGYAGGVDYSNEEIDDLLSEGRATLDPDARRDIYRRIEEILLLEDVPWILLLWRPQGEAAWSYVNGYVNVPNIGARNESYMERVWLNPDNR